MRAILHYQMMHAQLLTVAIKSNQLILNGPQRGLSELELLDNNISSPNPIIDLDLISMSATDMTNPKNRKFEKSRFESNIKNNAGEIMYFIMPKKEAFRDVIAKKFLSIYQKLMGIEQLKPIPILRMLRSYRIKLLHEYCNQVLKETYVDTLKIQTV